MALDRLASPPLDVAVVEPANLVVPVSPDRFQALRTGQVGQFEWEPNEQWPIDGSDRSLRSMSPFILRVEPPLEYAGWDPAQNPKADPGIISRAFQGTAGFASARGSLRQAAFVTGEGSGGSSAVKETVQKDGGKGVPPGKKNASGESTRGLPKTSILNLYAAVDIATQLRTSVTTPPLVLLINPQSLQMSFAKVQQYQDRTRYGYVFHSWGEEQPKMTVSARCGAFYSEGRGVQRASRRDSASWQNMMTLFQFYRNNGYIHDTVGKSNAHHFVGTLSIQYDQWIYYGNMETFSWTEEETNAHGGITFEMAFTVSAMADTAGQPLVVNPLRDPMSLQGFAGMSENERYYQSTTSVNAPGEFQFGASDGNAYLQTQGRIIAGGPSKPSASPPTALPTSRQGFRTSR